MAAFTRTQRRARVAIVRTRLTVLVAACATLAACSQSRQFELRGQILAIDRGRQEVTIKHEDIRGLMPGMTMPFKVEDARLLDGLTAGDLVKATLVVKNSNGYLSAIERTGHEAVTATPPPPRVDLLEPGQHVPDVRLVDETGKPRTAYRLARPHPGRHVHVHALSIPRLLSQDGSTVPGRPDGHPRGCATS